MVNENEIIETFDLTPTWGAMLPAILICYKEALKKKVNSRSFNKNAEEIINNLEAELTNMAKVADLYNESKKRESFTRDNMLIMFQLGREFETGGSLEDGINAAEDALTAVKLGTF